MQYERWLLEKEESFNGDKYARVILTSDDSELECHVQVNSDFDGCGVLNPSVIHLEITSHRGGTCEMEET